MRAFIAAVVTTAALSISVDALHAQRAPIRFGVLAGANLSSINTVDDGLSEAGNALFANERRAGGQAALYATIPVNGRFSLQPELHYIQKGGKASFVLNTNSALVNPADADRLTLGVRLSYVETPVLARFELANASRSWRPFVFAGPSFSLKTSCTASSEIGDLKLSGSCSDDTTIPDDEAGAAASESTDPVRSTDIGAIGGIGLQGALLNHQFSLQVRYMHGLRSIANEPAAGASAKNRGFAFVLGLGF